MSDSAGPRATGGTVFSRLWVRLLLAFAAILLFAVVVPTAYVRRQSQIEFQQYATTNQAELLETIAGALALGYLSDGGSWRGAQENATTAAGYLGRRIVITDAGGTVVADDQSGGVETAVTAGQTEVVAGEHSVVRTDDAVSEHGDETSGSGHGRQR